MGHALVFQNYPIQARSLDAGQLNLADKENFKNGNIELQNVQITVGFPYQIHNRQIEQACIMRQVIVLKFQ